MLFMQAAQVILMRPQNRHKFRSGPWSKAAAMRKQHNRLGVALPNKPARIAWSALRSGNGLDTKDNRMAVAI